jgi:carboxynorspermidine decarboxylase
MLDFDITNIETPCYIVDERLLIKNLEVLKSVKDRTGVKILLAQKAFAMYAEYKLIGDYLDGTTASGLFEARLGYEEMGKETHIFAPAYTDKDFSEIMLICDHIIFNSFAQWDKYGKQAIAVGKSCGIRINPEISTQEHGIYDPCAANSRLGVTLANFPDELPQGIDGLHFHTLCEQNSDALAITINEVEKKFGKYLRNLKWLNFGGGHHITREDYDIDLLCSCIEYMRDKYGLQIYIEPGEAVVLNTGYLVTTVEDIIDNGMKIAILDTSAACHMPDVLEMPYRPPLMNSGLADEKAYTYRLGTITCLAGDIIGDYSFDKPLAIGDKLIFGDMAHYSMVKNNMFNGINLPSIYKVDTGGNVKLIKSFEYSDYKQRLS